MSSPYSLPLLHGMKALTLSHKHTLRSELPKIYSQDLVNNLFRHPYTKIEFVMGEIEVTRQTAAKYLDELVKIGLLSKHKIGKDNYYLNDALYRLLLGVGTQSEAPHV